MVVWIFAGGGEAEIEGLIPFFRKNFPICGFQRRSPVRQKRGPKPGKEIDALGKTGKSLSRQIKYQLPKSFFQQGGTGTTEKLGSVRFSLLLGVQVFCWRISLGSTEKGKRSAEVSLWQYK